MQTEKSTTKNCFRSVLAVKMAYLPSLMKSQSQEHVQESVKRTAKITENTLRKCVKK